MRPSLEKKHKRFAAGTDVIVTLADKEFKMTTLHYNGNDDTVSVIDEHCNRFTIPVKKVRPLEPGMDP